jgi:hypothetical protein
MRGINTDTRTAWTVAVCLMVAMSPALYSTAQTTPTAVSKSSLEQVAEELQTQYGPVRFHRDEELEERFAASSPTPAVLSSVPHLFQVQGLQFQLSNGGLVERIPTGVPTLYIATSPDGSKVYKLAGFPSAEGEFNRLVADNPMQKIRRIAEAESRGLLCAELVYGLSSGWWIDDDSNAKLQAAKYFFNQGHEDALILADKWWLSFLADKRPPMRITTAKFNDTFRVELPIFWAPVEGDNGPPQIKVYSIKVSDNGTCHNIGEAIYK